VIVAPAHDYGGAGLGSGPGCRWGAFNLGYSRDDLGFGQHASSVSAGVTILAGNSGYACKNSEASQTTVTVKNDIPVNQDQTQHQGEHQQQIAPAAPAERVRVEHAQVACETGYSLHQDLVYLHAHRRYLHRNIQDIPEYFLQTMARVKNCATATQLTAALDGKGDK
jgi:hypothetical protein